MDDTETYLTTAEAAQRFGVDPQTIRGWAKRGKIPHTRTPGGQLRFAESVVAKLSERGDES